MVYFALTTLLILIELLYLKLALKNNIFDKPNLRSSHITPTIRGGGIVIPLSVIFFFFISDFQYLYFVSGLMIISITSFYDDLRTLNNRIRIIIQIVALLLMFQELDFFDIEIWLIVVTLIVTLGAINAVNFMDGINGMSCTYGMVTLASIWYLDYFEFQIMPSPLFVSVLISLIVFATFNFRKHARCFAGDVGSISLGFVICFLLLSLIVSQQDLSIIVVLSVYGVDSVLTIIYRLLNKENIFKAHRKHLYQYLVNISGFPHLVVSTIYAVLQLSINLIFILNMKYLWFDPYTFLVFVLITLSSSYVFIKYNIKDNREISTL
ncbi:MAG: UDP-GlcNAc:undecaprenyl-phosphate GlcNAc-1-phosphate transferase [Cyclobacteriaceae bacterium]